MLSDSGNLNELLCPNELERDAAPRKRCETNAVIHNSE